MSLNCNRELKAEFRDFFLGTVNLKVNGKEYTFSVERVLVVPEGSGAVYMYPGYFANKRVAVIDIGGLNVNFSIFNNLVPEVSSMFTSNLGGNCLESTTINSLNTKYGISLNPSDIDYVFRQGGLKIKGKIEPGSINVVQESTKDYVSQIINEIRKHDHDLNILDVIVIGGTASIIENELKNRIEHAFIVDQPQLCNVNGFLKIGELKYGNE